MSEKRKFIPYNDMTDEEKREFHRKGGLAAQKKNKERRELKRYLLALLDSKTNTGDVAMDMCWALVSRALNGDVKAFETIRSTIGEDAPQKLDATVDNKIINVTIEEE